MIEVAVKYLWLQVLGPAIKYTDRPPRSGLFAPLAVLDRPEINLSVTVTSSTYLNDFWANIIIQICFIIKDMDQWIHGSSAGVAARAAAGAAVGAAASAAALCIYYVIIRGCFAPSYIMYMIKYIQQKHQQLQQQERIAQKLQTMLFAQF